MSCSESFAAKSLVENTTSSVQQKAVTPAPKAAGEEKAVAQLKMVFEGLDLDAEQTVDRVQFQKAIETSKFGVLFAEDVKQIETLKDGRISWSHLEFYMTKAAIKVLLDQDLKQLHTKKNCRTNWTLLQMKKATITEVEESRIEFCAKLKKKIPAVVEDKSKLMPPQPPTLGPATYQGEVAFLQL